MGGALDPAVARVRVAVRAALASLAIEGVLASDDLVLVACSGGADSLALAAAAGFEGPRAGVRVGAVVIDHGLQDGSAQVAEAAGAALRGLGLAPVRVDRVRVGTGGGPEAAAREARYAALASAADDLGARAVLLGHTRDDQAETVLLGLARGAGARSLAGMAPRNERWVRPLLDVDRATTRAACAAAGLPVWDDPHNADRAYARVRARHDVLPALEAALGPGVAGALARTARLLRDDADALDGWAQQVGEGPDPLSVAALGALPAAVRTRVLRRAALAAGCPAGALSAEHVTELDRLVTDWHGQGPLHLPGRVRADRACGRLTFAASGDAARPARTEPGGDAQGNRPS